MKSIALLSGGLDSLVSMAYAQLESAVELCLTFDYGQRAAAREISAASSLAAYYNIKHKVIALPFLKEITSTALVNRAKKIPTPGRDELHQSFTANKSAAEVWVPNRNGLFISIAACYAEMLGGACIITGFNKEEAKTFPDNSVAFVERMNEALACSAKSRVCVISYTQRLNKVDIVRLGKRLRIPWQFIWSCYYGGQTACGVCESCQRLQKAMEAVD